MKQVIFLFLFFSALAHSSLLPLVFDGNKELSKRELYEALNLHKPYIYEFWKISPSVNPDTAALLSETVKNFYRAKGFFHATVTHYEENGSIHISIEENFPVRVSDISILSVLDIRSLIPFKIGDVFDADRFDTSKKSIRLSYANQGYCNAQLEAKAWIDTDANLAYIVYDIIPNTLCYFGSIDIEPSHHIDAEIIRSLLYIKEDEPFSPEKIRRSYESLYGHEGISKAIINTKADRKESASVSISVTENEKPIRFQAGLGASSDEGLMASAAVKHRNLFNNLKTLSLSARLTEIKKTLKSNFDMPLENRNTTGVEVGFENERFLGFKEERLFGSVFIRQRETPHVFQQSLVFDNAITYDSEDQDLFPQGKLFVLSPKLQWDYDSRDNLLDPTRGHFFHSSVMGSLESRVSDASYYKYLLSGGYIIPFLPSVLAFKVDFGSLKLYNGGLPASYRFYTGGMNSNRAYGYRKLGPTNTQGDPLGSDSVLEITSEYRFSIYGNFRGVLFNDNTFISGHDTPDYTQGYYSAGLGIRYGTPIGPLAIDFGFDIEDPTEQFAVHFHIGEQF